MSDWDKIKQLIQARTSENNHLAIQLMMQLLDYSFEEAFAELQLARIDDLTYQIEITHIRIEYKVFFQDMMYVPAAYADIDRRIFYKNKVEPASELRIYADEESILTLGIKRDPRELAEIKEDLQAITPHIQALYEYMQQGY